MSRVITNTNIIVDDFSFCKSFPKGTFIHFLTHYHSDHYEGLSALWDYGPIHCTPQTYKFITHNFPKIKDIHPHDYQEECVLEVQPGLLVRFWMFDAKHIPGSAMILFQGYMGTILFTGDFRYNFSMVTENPVLFPPARREGSKKTEIEAMTGISIHIDEMIFDNTYCNASFKFEIAEKISKLMISIIERNKSKKLVYIAMGALGKHQILS
jgi:DNA cross-link repair 1B protein